MFNINERIEKWVYPVMSLIVRNDHSASKCLLCEIHWNRQNWVGTHILFDLEDINSKNLYLIQISEDNLCSSPYDNLSIVSFFLQSTECGHSIFDSM